jgi:hypothetical protein
MNVEFDVSHALHCDRSKAAVKEILSGCATKLRTVDPTARVSAKDAFRGGHAVFSMQKLFHPQSSAVDNASALRALLNCLTAINVDYLVHHSDVPLLEDSGVQYTRTEVWDPIPALYRKQYGDCKSLTACRVAERRANCQFADPVFRFAKNPTGKNYHLFFHILVQIPEYPYWQDPSKECGMLLHEHAYANGNPSSQGADLTIRHRNPKYKSRFEAAGY